MDFKTLHVQEIHDKILLVTLNRSEVCNAINSVMMQDWYDFWKESNKNKELRCIIITGAGKAFCAGADLKERRSIALDTWKAQHNVLVKSMQQMLACPIPIISAVNGAAFGGGLEIILASDFAYAANTAIFSQSEVKIGLIPGAFGTQHLSRVAGIKRAKELIFTGAVFKAEEALQWSIINKITEPSELMSEVLSTAIKIADNAPLAIKAAKKTINATQETFLPQGFDCELQAYHEILMSADREEGILAFNEKRKPNFTGN